MTTHKRLVSILQAAKGVAGTPHGLKAGGIHLILVVGGAEHLHEKAVPQASREPVGCPFAD